MRRPKTGWSDSQNSGDAKLLENGDVCRCAYLEMMPLILVRPHVDSGKDDRILKQRHVAIDVVSPLHCRATSPVCRCTDTKTVSTGEYHRDGQYSLENVSSSALRQLSLNRCAAGRWIHVSASKGISMLDIAATEPSRAYETAESGMPNQASTLETTQLQPSRIKTPARTFTLCPLLEFVLPPLLPLDRLQEVGLLPLGPLAQETVSEPVVIDDHYRVESQGLAHWKTCRAQSPTLALVGDKGTRKEHLISLHAFLSQSRCLSTSASHVRSSWDVCRGGKLYAVLAGRGTLSGLARPRAREREMCRNDMDPEKCRGAHQPTFEYPLRPIVPRADQMCHVRGDGRREDAAAARDPAFQGSMVSRLTKVAGESDDVSLEGVLHARHLFLFPSSLLFLFLLPCTLVPLFFVVLLISPFFPTP